MGCLATDEEDRVDTREPRLPFGPLKIADGSWLFNRRCAICTDSGITVHRPYGPDQCSVCEASRSTTSGRVFGAISHLKLKQVEIDPALLKMARALVSASAEAPTPGAALAFLLRCNEREVKSMAKRLRDEWRLPIVGTRQKPYGYFIAANAEEFLDWMRTTKSQAISELATAYHLFKANFAELAGQRSLDFVESVSADLQEAIR